MMFKVGKNGIKTLILVIGVLLTVAWVTITERQALSGMQRRRGPNVVGWNGQFQALGDGLKLILKESVLLTRSDSYIFKF